MICRCGHGWPDHLQTGKCWCGCCEWRDGDNSWTRNLQEGYAYPTDEE